MNKISRTITGIITIALGLVLIVISFFDAWGLLIYGIPMFIIGFFIFFNKKEDEIEQIRDKSEGGEKDE